MSWNSSTPLSLTNHFSLQVQLGQGYHEAPLHFKVLALIVQITFISSIFIAGGHGVKCCNGYVTVAVLEASCQINHCQNSWKWQTSAPSLSS